MPYGFSTFLNVSFGHEGSNPIRLCCPGSISPSATIDLIVPGSSTYRLVRLVH